MIDLATINDALDCYVEVLRKQEAEANHENPDDWIKAREKLHYKILNAKNTKTKIAINLKNSQCGRTPKTLKHLLNLTAKDGMGEYVHFGEALDLMPYSLDADTVTMSLHNAIRSGVVDTSLELLEDGGREVRKLRKLDVLRLAAYLEVHG